MGKLYFKNITDTNEKQVRKIELRQEQEHFIETVAECLEEASIYKEWHPVAIYYDEHIIGFAMYGSFGPNKDTWIDRIMIDKRFQGKGYGRMAMERLIPIVAQDYGVDVIYLSILEENTVARRLYESIGFAYMDEKDPNGELIFKYVLD
ncbi:GNAT family N-acetyltransferase [Ornithinibacillus halotolerans]|uniref:Diamine N-acetyltransferase n=1 Tax=Ornithinibacillus halotolerans TaxID=1274357 RepID=A0A916RVT2_9BACI|nr:GNAT family N-acetyltransferase [Ornithinibacillus halotolerans]GGA71637.1 diamine N-acetyltransferase [Ornithinibacillus halotolerans]